MAEHLRRWGAADALRVAAPLPVASLDTHLGPAVQYWVVGAGRGATSGLIGRLDLAGIDLEAAAGFPRDRPDPSPSPPGRSSPLRSGP